MRVKEKLKNMKNCGVKSDLIISVDLISSVTKNSDDYNEKYMKHKFHSDDDWCLNKTIDTAQKWSFPLRISSLNVTKSPGNCEFGHIY